MRRTRIDFASPGLRRTLFRAPPTLIYAVPGVLALCIPALFMTQRYVEQQEEVRALQAALAARSAPAPVAAPPGRATAGSVAGWRH